MSRCGFRHKALAVSVATTAMLTACFTGIESTPRITADDVRRSVPAKNAAEETYLSDVQPQSLTQWQPGKAFYVTDPRIGLAMTVAPAGAALEAGDTLRFRSVRDVTSIMGSPVAELTFAGPRGIEATYRADVPLKSFESIRTLTVPFTVELSTVDNADSLLGGKEFWVMSSEWLDSRRRPRRGRKFIRVTIDGVERGDDVYPLCVTAIDRTAEPPDTFRILMALDGGTYTSSRRFASFFALTDPHSRYPQITDRMWALIQRGQVAEGMTRLEVKLAIGEPRDVQRRAGYSSLGEVWTYDNGRYLLFEDRLLKQSR